MHSASMESTNQLSIFMSCLKLYLSRVPLLAFLLLLLLLLLFFSSSSSSFLLLRLLFFFFFFVVFLFFSSYFSFLLLLPWLDSPSGAGPLHFLTFVITLRLLYTRTRQLSASVLAAAFKHAGFLIRASAV